MSDIRRSILSTTPVLIATDRAQRPDDFAKKITEESGEIKEKKVCPFCPGNEHMTPKPEYARIEEPGQNWTLRAFPNKYPAATPEERSSFFLGIADSRVITNAYGAHEVIVETENHDEDMDSISVWKIFNLLIVLDGRVAELYCYAKIRSVSPFKNFGEPAGASLKHPHWQIIALPDVPEKIINLMHRLREHKIRHSRDAFEEIIEQADQFKLVIRDSQNFLCLAPYNSKLPFEMTIMPKQSVSRLTDTRAQFQELATMISVTFRALYKVLNYLPPYNMYLEEVPPNIYCRPEEFFRWRLRILPRLTKVAGFELSTGYYINPLPPERAAEALKKAVAELEPLPAMLRHSA